MKKLFALLMALVFACTFLTAVCETATPLRIVCTTFPQYDWTRQLLGDRADDVELTLLLDNGIDLHNYQPTADDIIKIARSDLFIYVGGESDAWVNDLLETSQNSHVKALSMLACVDAKEEEAVEGMQEEAHECGHAHHEAEYDEHVWTSFGNMARIVTAVRDTLTAALPEQAATLQANAASYLLELDALRADYQATVASATGPVLVIADRYPFAYLMRELGVVCYAAFHGCSSETQASFSTQVMLTETVRDLHLPAVLYVDFGVASVADAVSRATGVPVRRLWSGQVASDTGLSYLDMLRENLVSLRAALGVTG